MPILIVSDNPLFKEVIIASIAEFQNEFIELNPEQAMTRICELRPDVMIVDEMINPSVLEDILAGARELQKTRTILLNPFRNEILLIDSRRATLKKADDLLEAISSNEKEIHPEIHASGQDEVRNMDKKLTAILAFLSSASNKTQDADQPQKKTSGSI